MNENFFQEDSKRNGLISTILRKINEFDKFIRDHTSVQHGNISSVNGISVLGATYSIAAALGTYVDTGLSVSIPSAGRYRLTANARVSITGNAGTAWYIVMKLYNATLASDIANSVRLPLLVSVTGINTQITSQIDVIADIASACTISLYAKRDGGGAATFTLSDIATSANGESVLTYERLN